ncbi:MAG TPA: hypothetical protein VM848_05145 [Acidimicrobiia bacterium]|nr:hypothetical protein [Acidimicrobiia bacterium]
MANLLSQGIDLARERRRLLGTLRQQQEALAAGNPADRFRAADEAAAQATRGEVLSTA